jgi:RHS repeat-associated protein
VPIDLLGDGTACLVWSSPLQADGRRPMRYVNLMGRRKPHLLIKTINNLGAETQVDYAPSTKFYLQDKRDGKPWITRLPFPVHVVERVDTYDHISRNRFVTRYAYHHGHFDGEEREFRGFGLVEQWDTEEFATLVRGDLPADNVEAASHVPPVHTRTWFHTGVYLGRDHVSDFFAGLLNAADKGEYFRQPDLSDDEARAMLLPDTVLPPGLTPGEERQACRALRGLMLRQEVYADDADYATANLAQIERARRPYTITERNFTVRSLQPPAANGHAVFFTHAREALNYHYERNPADPRIEHALTLKVDGFGNVLEQAAIGYGRRQGDASLPTDADRLKQALVHITCTENTVTNSIAALTDHYRTPLPAESRTYELRKPRQETSSGGSTRLFRFDDLLNHVTQAADGAHDIAYEDIEFARARQAAANDPAEADRYFRRLIERVRTVYRPDDCGGPLNDPFALLSVGVLERLALAGESYRLALTPGLIAEIFHRPRDGQPDEVLLPDPTAVLGGTAGDEGGYVDLDGDGRWWVPSGRSFYHDANVTAPVELAEARAHFFLTRRYRDPFGNQSTVAFDGPSSPAEPKYDLLIVETLDALGNRVTVDATDYRVLQPLVVSDANRNRAAAVFDVLGMTVATAVMGKPSPAGAEGDTLGGLVTELTAAQLDQFVSAPRRPSASPNESEATPIVHDLLRGATTRIVYDLDRFRRAGEPPFAATIVRETHVSDLQPGRRSKLQISFSYSDGFGREIQKKIQAEPGPLVDGGAVVNPRWVGTGWTIFNNKGKPVRQYEPFFSRRQRADGTFFSDHHFEFGVAVGVSPVLFYDPIGRVVATLHPNHTYEKVVFSPWQQTTYDGNDTCFASNAESGDPRTDADIRGYVAGYFTTQPATWNTWHAERIAGGALGQHEQEAAARAAGHADTPTTVHFDALGRPFLTVARNRVTCAGHDLDGTEDSPTTRVDLDIEGNQREVRDERKRPTNYLPTGTSEQRVIMRYAYDMLGTRIRQFSMEAGARWMLNDVAGKPIRAWDARGHNFTTAYDALRRPVKQTVRGTMPSSDSRTLNRDIVVDEIEYGEGLLNAGDLNLRTRIYQHFDSAGIVTNARLDAGGNPVEAYDFKGNLLRRTRRLATDYKEIPDWSQNPGPRVDAERFESSTRYDALNRPARFVAPHSSVTRAEHPNKFNIVQPMFNEANLLESLHVWLERSTEPAGLLDPTTASPVGVDTVEYDAKGQRRRIDYKNGTSTSYTYDPLTFRLTQLVTRRDEGVFPDDDPHPAIAGWPGSEVQKLHYTYDPVGNITHIRDEAQQAIYFRNQRVEPSGDYTYDALYRLVEARGREHLGQTGAPIPHSYNDARRVGILSANPPGRFAPNDRAAMGAYIERYVYDAVGNFLQMQHERSDTAVPGWTRRYDYAEASLIEPAKRSNRLSRTRVGSSPSEVYSHDAHGNLIQMPQLQVMEWDYRDQLQVTQRQRVSNDDADGIAHDGELTYYVYDAAGQRVRKVTEASADHVKDERIYLGGFEIFRDHGGASAPIGARTATLERETLHVMDDEQRVALVETRTLDAAGTDQASRQLIRFQFGNHLGSACLELDERAGIISYEEYAPYGSTTYQAVRSQTETPKRYRYTGTERDEESGFYYHQARYYAAWLGRWISPDPLGLQDHINLFAAMRLNPIKYRDPSGMQNLPHNFVSFAETVQEGLSEIQRLGEAHGREFGLGRDPATGRLMVLEGSANQVVFGNLTPLAHTHTGADTTVHPSTDDLNILAERGVPEHWIYSSENGWGRLRFDPASNSFELIRIQGENLVRQHITENPNFDPADTSPAGRMSRWITSEPEILRPIRVPVEPASRTGPRSGRPIGEAIPLEPAEPTTPTTDPFAPRTVSARLGTFVDSATPGAAKAIAVAALIYATYDISNKTEKTTREKGVAMGLAQMGKTTAKHATAALWFAFGASIALSLVTAGAATPLAASALAAILITTGTAATHQYIDAITPGLD